jgi:hypothetical protein
MKAITAIVLIIVAGGLWVSAYFWEFSARVVRYFFGDDAGFPATRKKNKRKA